MVVWDGASYLLHCKDKTAAPERAPISAVLRLESLSLHFCSPAMSWVTVQLYAERDDPLQQKRLLLIYSSTSQRIRVAAQPWTQCVKTCFISHVLICARVQYSVCVCEHLWSVQVMIIGFPLSTPEQGHSHRVMSAAHSGKEDYHLNNLNGDIQN